MSAAAPLLQVAGLHKRFGGVAAVAGVDLDIMPAEVHALIGPNGAGKTTFIELLSGALRADDGSVWFDGRDVTRLPMHARVRLGLGRSYQITSVFPHFTALENIALASQADRSPFGFWRDTRDDVSLFETARARLASLGLAERAETLAGELSHGERRRLDLGLALASGARLLLMDEPMAGMGAEEAAHILAFLEGLKRQVTILLVEHDMDAVFRLADRVTTLVYGQAIATGTPEEVRRNPEVRRAYLGETEGTTGAELGAAAP